VRGASGMEPNIAFPRSRVRPSPGQGGGGAAAVGDAEEGAAAGSAGKSQVLSYGPGVCHVCGT
jgi:hypothetical protein